MLLTQVGPCEVGRHPVGAGHQSSNRAYRWYSATPLADDQGAFCRQFDVQLDFLGSERAAVLSALKSPVLLVAVVLALLRRKTVDMQGRINLSGAPYQRKAGPFSRFLREARILLSVAVHFFPQKVDDLF